MLFTKQQVAKLLKSSLLIAAKLASKYVPVCKNQLKDLRACTGK